MAISGPEFEQNVQFRPYTVLYETGYFQIRAGLGAICTETRFTVLGCFELKDRKGCH